MGTENGADLKEFLFYENNLYYERHQGTDLKKAKHCIIRSPKS